MLLDGATTTVVKTLTVTSTTRATIEGLTARTSYYATVRATNAIGSSRWSTPSNTVMTTR